MSHLHEALAGRVDEWRSQGYPCDEHPAISEILNFGSENEEDGQLRFLRKAQYRALETYWYLRLVLDTPRIVKLYEHLFTKPSDRREAMGLNAEEIREFLEDEGWHALYDRIRADNRFVKKHNLESLRETLTLDYPSYILALAMGAGKTILMGTIVATEFAMAQEYPEGPFVQNSLIFAPGKTIVESLREIADIPFDKILPPRMYKPFAASLKLTFTRDGDKELPVVWGSSWNVVVTNTEKIRIQKSTGRRKNYGQMDWLNKNEEHAQEEANLRLSAIASLPHLAIFSDEAHHTYGQKLLGQWKENSDSGKLEFVEQGIKKVRKTVDYLASETNLIVVVNTTGTPYFERQPLRDVVIWYGLGEGIQDGVLKALADNIRIFDMDEGKAEYLVKEIIDDFIDDYWSVRIHDGSPARLALYFPNTKTLDELRPTVDSALALHGIDVSSVLAVHSKASEETKRDFYRVAHDPESPHRVILLVNMGTEGWNCPSLFACGLVRKLKSSNNFVLQAATRCLRQVPDNDRPARVYVSKGNKSILEKQLAETYGTTLVELNATQTERVERTVELRKPDMPPILIKKQIMRFRRKAATAKKPLKLTKPDVSYSRKGSVGTFTIAEPKEGQMRLIRVDGSEDSFEIEPMTFELYGAAAELAANYHLSLDETLKALRNAYDADDVVPEHHMEELGKQIETQRSDYEQDWEEIDVALALVKADGFQAKTRNGVPVYTAQISFAKDRENLYKVANNFADDELAQKYSFHYEGYNFDSQPEVEYLERVLQLLKQHPDEVDGVWFTGGLTDPGKTELFAEYLGDDGRWHRYTPDFVIRRKDGKHLIVEVKKDEHSADIRADLERYRNGKAPQTAEGRKAVALQRWQDLNPETLHYEVVFANGMLHANALERAETFITGGD